MASKKSIVITTINSPTEAISTYAKMPDYSLIVISDRKTPKQWNCSNVDYLSIKEQLNLPFNLTKHLPYNHYSRKMLGYLKAIYNKAEYIIETDDDNIPKNNWKFPDFEEAYECLQQDLGFVNIYQLFTKQEIWPRGMPLSLITKKIELEKYISLKYCSVGVWQGLADGDPDVDALYRLTNNAPCYFKERGPIVLDKGTVCPFNTQNTIFRKELFVLMYLPVFVSMRFTDILRGLVAQPIMWLYNYQLGYTNATVFQKRNLHNFKNDFVSEIPLYKYSDVITELISNSISASENIASNLYNSYYSLLKSKIVCNKEMVTLETWLNDLVSIL